MQFYKIVKAFVPVLLFILAGNEYRMDAQDGFVNPDFDYAVSKFILQPDGKIIAGGGFNNVGGQPRGKVARLNADGTLDTSFQNPQIVGASSHDGVYAMARQTDGKVMIAGFFTSVGGQSQSYLARLNIDGSRDISFNPILSNVATAVAVQDDGKIIVGGYFTAVNGQTRTRLARLNSDGSLDGSFANPALGDYPEALAIQADGKILVGGWFTSVGGQSRMFTARLNFDGTLDTGFNLTINGPAVQFVIQPDAKIILSGYFNVVNSTSHHVVARVNPDGSVDPSFQDAPILSGNVTKMDIQGDGKVIIGGAFSEINGQERRDLARLTANGVYDPTFQDVNSNFGGSFNSSINTILVQPDGKVLIGGSFSMVGHQTRNNGVRLLADGTLDLPPAQTLTVTKTADTNDGVCDADCSLREAVTAANALASPSAVSFALPLFSSSQTITLSLGELFIEDNHRVSITGPGANLLTISGNNSSRILRVKRDDIVTITGLTMTNGNGVGGFSSNEGGAIFIEPNGVATQLSLINTVVSGNTATVGGAIRGLGMSTLNITGSTIIGNVANYSPGGGGIYFDTGTLNITNSTISNNTASFQNGAGGGISVGSAIFNLTGSTVTGNSATFTGGISVGGTGALLNSTITNNHAASAGGGLGVSSNGNITLTDTTINGNSIAGVNGNGGGISNNGRVTLINSTVSNNSATSGGGIFTAGGLTTSGSTINLNTATNGAGIYNNAGGTTNTPVTLTNSLIRDNNASSFGGGIYNRDAVNVVNSTVINNFSGTNGGGAFNVLLNGVGAGTLTVTASTFSANTSNAAGAGIANQSGAVILTNSTVSGNTAHGVGGGIHTNVNGSVSLNHSTVAFNIAAFGTGGGVNNSSAVVNSRNSIIAANRAGSPAVGSDIGGGLTSGGYNLFENSANGTITGTLTGNILGQNAQLGPLTDNGGPTLTHALLATSPAIDAGDPSNVLAVDQRAILRPVDGNGDGLSRVDIGAYESSPVFVTNISDSGPGSLRQAIADAAAGHSDTVVFNGSQFDSPQVITLTGGELVIPSNANFSLGGKGAGLLTIDGNNQSRVLFVSAGAKLTISGVTVTGGNGMGSINSGHDGGISNWGTLMLINSVVRNNSANGNGGGIGNNLNAAVTILNSTIRNNSATASDGGAIFVQNSTATISNSTINNNLAGSTGGGIASNFGSITITNSTISENAANGGGGGISNSTVSSTLNIVNSTISGNSTANNSGGGINNQTGGTVNALNSIFADNSGPSPDFSGPLTSQGYNLIENTTGTTISGIILGNLLGQDPMLDPRLMLNGGITATHALRVGSPAIDAGSATNPTLTADQRGFARPYNFPNIVNPSGGNASDIGAFERQAVDVSGLPFAVVNGRVLTSDGRGIRNASVSISDGQTVRRTTTSSLGLFTFENVPTGPNYTITVMSKLYRFSPQSVQITGDLTLPNFVGQE